MALTDETRTKISGLLDGNRVVLFMKGSKLFPQCGFSASVVQLLTELGVPFETANVLDDPDLRQGIKEFSDWPTIPQLYVDKEFVGGSDIVRNLYGTGELHQMLGVELEEVEPPEITLTPSMLTAFEGASQGDEGDLRIEISPDFQYQVGFGDKQPGDMVIQSGGIQVLMSRGAASRAQGMTLDFAPGPDGGIIIDNPNEPPKVRNVDVASLKQLLDDSAELHLFDVRTDEERAIATIPAAVHLDQDGSAKLAELAKDAMIVLHCHHGGRSQAAAEQLLQQGYTNVYNVPGGIDAWAVQVDPSVARY